MSGCQQKRTAGEVRPHLPGRKECLGCLAAFAVFLFWSVDAHAVPFEVGLGFGVGQSHPNQFRRSMSRFHSQLNGDEFGTVIGDQETFGAEREFWFRASDIFGPEHYFGLGFGTYSFPTTRLTEWRSDGEVVDFDFRFQVQYQIFKYDFSRRLSRSWDYEVGGGFGFLFGSGIRVSGYKVKGIDARTYGGRHAPDHGNLWRLGVGLKRPVSDHLVLRFGLRLTHLYYGNLRGRLNELESSYYFTRDGGLTIVSALEAAEAAVTYDDPLFGVVTAAAVRSRAWVSEGRTELYASIGVRF